MDYSQDEVYEYILDRADKKGSDFFQRPYILAVFQTETYDFLDELIPILESDQRTTQDLQRIMLTAKVSLVDDPADSYKTMLPLPEKLYHLSRVMPVFAGGVTSRRPKIIRHGNENALKADPHNRPTVQYPLITQHTDVVVIDSGIEEKPLHSLITYLAEPDFAKEDELEKRIVNLPNGVIESIIQKCIKELVSSKGDQRAQSEILKERGNRNRKE